MAWIYFLQEENSGRFYIGSTSDLSRRLEQHQSGHTHSTFGVGVPTPDVVGQGVEIG